MRIRIRRVKNKGRLKNIIIVILRVVGIWKVKMEWENLKKVKVESSGDMKN